MAEIDITAKINKDSVYKLICFVNLALTIMPAIDYYSPWYISLLPVFLLVFPTIFRDAKGTRNFLIMLFTISAFSLLEWYFVKRSMGTISYFVHNISAFTPCFIAVVLKNRFKDKQFFVKYLQIVALLLAITSITTMIGLNKYPRASRELAAVNIFAPNIDIYYKANIGGFQFIYALVLFLPVIVWLIENSNKYLKALNIVELILFVSCIYESQYTTALIMTVVSLLVIFATKNKHRMKLVIILLVLLIAFNGLSLLGEVFEFFSESVEYDYVSDKLLQVSQLLKGEEINTETSNDRLELYQLSINSFTKNPIFGANIFNFGANTIGGHSTILDICAGGGMFALLAFIVIFTKVFRTIIGRRKIVSTVISIWVLLIVISCLNPTTFTLPIMISFTCAMCVQQASDNDEVNDSK